MKSHMSIRPAISGMSFTQSSIVCLIVALSFAVFMRSFYTEGDIREYLRSFEQISLLNPADAYVMYGLILGASEPVYFLVSYIFSQLGFSYDFFKVAMAVGLAVVVTKYLAINGVPLMSRLIFITTNFYIIALYAEAERLGLAVFFIVLGLILIQQDRTKFASIMIVAGVLSHFQMVLPIAAYGISRVLMSLLKKFDALYISKSTAQWVMVGIAFTAILLLTGNVISSFGDRIVEKIIFYYERRAGISSIFQAVLLLPVLMVMSRRILPDLITYSIIALPAIFIGSERINICLVFFYFLVVLRERRWFHPLNIIILAYFSFKGILFLITAIQHGRGY